MPKPVEHIPATANDQPAEHNMTAYFFRIHGTVQGVGFRYWAQGTARSIGLAGWVRNMPEGTVRIYACGNEEKLNRLTQELWSGPRYALVTNVTIEPEEVRYEQTNTPTYSCDENSTFTIRY